MLDCQQPLSPTADALAIEDREYQDAFAAP
jgi:hypothetical protein